MAAVYGEKENGMTRICVKISREKIAMLSGVHRVTVARELAKMKKNGLVRPDICFTRSGNLSG